MSSALAAARAAYGGAKVQTASPVQLVLACYDRVVDDLDAAADAISRNDYGVWVTSIQHAEDVITELAKAVRVELWEGAQTLLDLHEWALVELPQALFRKDAAMVARIRTMYAGLRDTWKQVATS